MRIMTLTEAKASGLSASQIRTTARCLQRIAKDGYGDRRSYGHPRDIRKNAADLFRLAKKMEIA